jgi:hypothetical protein
MNCLRRPDDWARRFHEADEIDFGDLNPRLCFEAAFCCDDD